MEKNTKKGLITGLIGVIFVGLQPIVAILRPNAADAYLSGAMTCIVEMMVFFPIMLIEFKLMNSNNQIFNKRENKVKKFQMLREWRKNFWLFIFIGLLFGLNQILFFVGYDLAGAINGSLTQKTTVFFSLFLGYLLLKERITKRQIIFSILLFFGLAISITQFFTLIDINLNILIGVGIILAISLMWIFGHTLTKPIFGREEVTPIQMVFIRNFISGVILLLTYLLIFTPDLKVFIEPDNLLFYTTMGVVYGSGLLCWYKTLSYLDVSKATVVFSPTPITSAIFATILLGEDFTIAHLIGTILVIISIIIIVMQKRS
ncbi:MAG: DMT family transporter [Candidatus Hodarchaeota archaeon]